MPVYDLRKGDNYLHLGGSCFCKRRDDLVITHTPLTCEGCGIERDVYSTHPCTSTKQRTAEECLAEAAKKHPLSSNGQAVLIDGFMVTFLKISCIPPDGAMIVGMDTGIPVFRIARKMEARAISPSHRAARALVTSTRTRSSGGTTVHYILVSDGKTFEDDWGMPVFVPEGTHTWKEYVMDVDWGDSRYGGHFE